MWIAGIILLLLAAGAAFYGRHRAGQARTATATDTLTCAELGELSSAVTTEIGGGSFSQRCEIVGKALAGPGGATQAPHSKADAVWYRAEVTHRYWQQERRERDGKSYWERVEHEDTVSNLTSENPFLIEDTSGGAAIAVAPGGADVDRPEQTVDRFEPGTSGGGASGGILDSVLSAVISGGDRSGTIGFNYREWVIRPGARVYVHGVASDSTGSLRFAKPDKGRYMISTRSEEEIVKEATTHAKWANIGAIVLAVVGAVLIVAGLATA